MWNLILSELSFEEFGTEKKSPHCKAQHRCFLECRYLKTLVTTAMMVACSSVGVNLGRIKHLCVQLHCLEL